MASQHYPRLDPLAKLMVGWDILVYKREVLKPLRSHLQRTTLQSQARGKVPQYKPMLINPRHACAARVMKLVSYNNIMSVCLLPLSHSYWMGSS